MDIKIRPISVLDRTALLQILKDTPEFKPSEYKVAKEVIDDCLKEDDNSGYFILVVRNNSDIVGYICYGPTPLTAGTWDIYWEAVSREQRGKGIGGKLLEAAEKEIRNFKGRLSLIETSSTPAYGKTRDFYHRHGYNEIARVPDFYEPGDDKIIYQKKFK